MQRLLHDLQIIEGMNTMAKIEEVLNHLKNQLDENSSRLSPDSLLDENDEDILREECIFNEPATEDEIKLLENELKIKIPNDFREFLLLHNGMILFKSYIVSYNFLA